MRRVMGPSASSPLPSVCRGQANEARRDLGTIIPTARGQSSSFCPALQRAAMPLSGQRTPLAQRLRQRAAIDIFKLTAHRHTPGKPGHLEPACSEQLANVMGGCLAFVSEVRGKHNFAHRAILRTLEQSIETDLLRTDTVER